ncbi:PSP1 C-terminal conserved region-domain-containing protein [Chlamydoabsidia padenii]|nr:PSP1 C-terminal conserved region-domain-containing protein [Chlamydoabsidia padenii]
MSQNNNNNNNNGNNNTDTRLSKKAEETGPIGIPGVNSTSADEAWKVVGSPSRRSSLAAPAATNNNNNTSDKQSPAASPTPNSVDIPGARRPSLDPSQWGSFGGFQWEGPGIFDTEARKSSHSATQMVPPGAPAPEVLVDDIPYAPHHRLSFTYDNSILSVPMLPGVSMEPIYRQQRSLSFSVGQDPTFFGYDDYDDLGTQTQKHHHQQQQQQQQLHYSTTSASYGYRNSLATMEEEQDDGEDDMLRDLIDQESNAARWRARSQSSGAAFGLLSPSQHAALLGRQLRRGSEQHDDLIQQRRRSSRFFGGVSDGSSSGQSAYPQMSMGDKERLELIQRRPSQSHGNDYTFPDQSYNLLQQRRHSLNQPHHPHHVQQLSEQLENTSIRTPTSDTYGQHPSITNSNYSTQQQQHLMQQHQQQHQQQHHQQAPSMTSNGPFRDAGKGIALQRLPEYTTLYSVEFKAGRVDYFYVPSEQGLAPVKFQAGDLVIVEGDRGKDLGKVTSDTLTIDKVEQLVSQKLQQQQALPDDDTSNEKPKDVHIKRLYRLATPDEINLLVEKAQDELRALALCQQKTKGRNLPMTVVDAEYQWDRRKLTFFFVSDRRNDFRELVRELFKIYKTRIWMCAVNPGTASGVTNPSLSSNTNNGN